MVDPSICRNIVKVWTLVNALVESVIFNLIVVSKFETGE